MSFAGRGAGQPMYRLAELGFTQSYNYFAWRNSKDELEHYFTELTQPPVADFFHPNLWPNTPDILTQFLQAGGRNAFAIRFILAATLGASYGIYGPAFELCENTPREPGSEEYLQFRKIRNQALGFVRATKPGKYDRAREPNPPRKCRPSVESQSAISSHGQSISRLPIQNPPTTEAIWF